MSFANKMKHPFAFYSMWFKFWTFGLDIRTTEYTECSKNVLLKIECSALLLQGLLDSEIKPNSMDEIFNRINSKNKRKIWLENNDRSILNSPDHQLIFAELIRFVSEIYN